MIKIDKLRALESIAIVAQDSAETGNLDQSVYADVFEHIATALHDIISEAERRTR